MSNVQFETKTSIYELSKIKTFFCLKKIRIKRNHVSLLQAGSEKIGTNIEFNSYGGIYLGDDFQTSKVVHGKRAIESWLKDNAIKVKDGKYYVNYV